MPLSGLATGVGAKKPMLGGVNATAEHFDPGNELCANRFNFVETQPGDGLRRKKHERHDAHTGTARFERDKPWDAHNVDLLTSTSWDEDLHAESAQTHLTFSLQDLHRRDAHRAHYIEWLKQSRATRVAKEKTKWQDHRAALMKRDRRDPFGVDLAMEKGLPEPIPKLPPADEPLWIKKNVGGVGGGPRTANDENKLVAKKFKVRPSTQAEVRDCAAEIAHATSSVVASHKNLDFGKVCVQSVCAKNFTVTNELSRCVLISLGRLEPELAKSTPPRRSCPRARPRASTSSS